MRNNPIQFITCILLLLSIIAYGSCAADTTVQEYPNTISLIEKESKRLMRKYHLPALAISVVDDQKIVYQQAKGSIDLENNIAAAPESVFKLWSLAKVFTAIEIFREVEEGLIDLDAPITDYLPDFSIKSRFNDPGSISTRDLLAHRAGLPRSEGLMPDSNERDISLLEKFEIGASNCYMAYPVQYRYKYSNLGYDLLGRVIENARQMGYYQYMEEYILDDLGMNNSHFYKEGFRDSLLIAKGYEYYRRSYHPLIQYNINNVPSGNLFSTIEDLTTFLRAVFEGKVFKNEATMALMFKDYYSNPKDPETMGLGWKTVGIDNKELLIWHDGGPTEGIGSLIAFLPGKKIGIALVGNGTTLSGGYSLPFAMEILNSLLEEKEGITPAKAEKPIRIKLDHDALREVEGKYVAFGTIMEIKARENKLKTKIGGIGLNLLPLDDGEFAVSNWMHRIGLTKLFKLPIDLSKIRISFINKTSEDSCYMIVNMGSMSHEICPLYPQIISIPEYLTGLEGEYKVAELLPGNKIGNYSGQSIHISLEDNVWTMSGIYGPIIPLSEQYIQIVGGPFNGETMEYNADSGNIVHQKTIFIPMKAD